MAEPAPLRVGVVGVGARVDLAGHFELPSNGGPELGTGVDVALVTTAPACCCRRRPTIST